eukprot:3890491-Amphidinium_carterae.1
MASLRNKSIGKGGMWKLSPGCPYSPLLASTLAQTSSTLRILQKHVLAVNQGLQQSGRNFQHKQESKQVIT